MAFEKELLDAGVYDARLIWIIHEGRNAYDVEYDGEKSVKKTSKVHLYFETDVKMKDGRPFCVPYSNFDWYPGLATNKSTDFYNEFVGKITNQKFVTLNKTTGVKEFTDDDKEKVKKVDIESLLDRTFKIAVTVESYDKKIGGGKTVVNKYNGVDYVEQTRKLVIGDRTVEFKAKVPKIKVDVDIETVFESDNDLIFFTPSTYSPRAEAFSKIPEYLQKKIVTAKSFMDDLANPNTPDDKKEALLQIKGIYETRQDNKDGVSKTVAAAANNSRVVKEEKSTFDDFDDFSDFDDEIPF